MRVFFALLIYNLLLPIGFVLMLPGQILRMRRRGGYGEQFCDRFGMFKAELRASLRMAGDRPWWIHAVSVGEQLIAHKMIAELRRSGTWVGPIVLSTSTSTGFRLAREKMTGDSVEVVYFPFDFPWFSWLAIRRTNPQRVVLVEAEVWPNFVAICHAREIPVTLVNARLSPRSERRFAKFAVLVSPIFGLLENVCVPEEEDGVRWAGLGVEELRIVVTGSMKHDAGVAGGRSELAATLESVLGEIFPNEREAPVFLVASTHPQEERWIVDALLTAEKSEDGTSMRIVVVPRHFERSADVDDDMRSLGLVPVRRSAPSALVGEGRRVLVVDTTGELGAWYGLSDLVVIGKSFCGNIGGQNPAEAVLQGKPVICGNRMDNFRALMADLHDADGVVVLEDDAALQGEIERYFREPEAFAEMAIRGERSLGKHQGAVNRTVAVFS